MFVTGPGAPCHVRVCVCVCRIRRVSPYIIPNSLVNMTAGLISIEHSFQGAPSSCCFALQERAYDGTCLWLCEREEHSCWFLQGEEGRERKSCVRGERERKEERMGMLLGVLRSAELCAWQRGLCRSRAPMLGLLLTPLPCIDDGTVAGMQAPTMLPPQRVPLALILSGTPFVSSVSGVRT